MVVDGLGEAQQGGQDRGDGCHVRFLRGWGEGPGRAPPAGLGWTQAALLSAAVASLRSVLRSMTGRGLALLTVGSAC